MIKIVAISIICSIIIVYLKNINSELTILVEIMSGIIIIFCIFDYLYETFYFIQKIIDGSGLKKDYFKILVKITAIGYIVEFGASIVEDFGIKSLSYKVIFAGKIIILCTAIPIIYEVFNLIMGFIQ